MTAERHTAQKRILEDRRVAGLGSRPGEALLAGWPDPQRRGRAPRRHDGAAEHSLIFGSSMRAGPASRALRRGEHAPGLAGHVIWAVSPRGSPTSRPGLGPPPMQSPRQRGRRCQPTREALVNHRERGRTTVVLVHTARRGGGAPRRVARNARPGRAGGRGEIADRREVQRHGRVVVGPVDHALPDHPQRHHAAVAVPRPWRGGHPAVEAHGAHHTTPGNRGRVGDLTSPAAAGAPSSPSQRANATAECTCVGRAACGSGTRRETPTSPDPARRGGATTAPGARQGRSGPPGLWTGALRRDAARHRPAVERRRTPAAAGRKAMDLHRRPGVLTRPGIAGPSTHRGQIVGRGAWECHRRSHVSSCPHHHPARERRTGDMPDCASSV